MNEVAHLGYSGVERNNQCQAFYRPGGEMEEYFGYIVQDAERIFYGH